MNSFSLKLEKRNEIGGGRARRLLEKGLIPAVVYGRDMVSTAALVNKKDLGKFLRGNGRYSVFTAEFAEEHDLPMLIKNIQYDPVSKDIIHLDFQRVSTDERVQVKIPVRVKGGENVNKNGYIVIHQLDSVAVECLPQNIPAHAEADISDLEPGYSFTAGDFKFSPGISLITKPDKVILIVTSSPQ